MVDAGHNHWWLFSVGGSFLLYGTVRLRLGLPSANRKRLTQGQFIRHCLLPLAFAATLFTVWYHQIQANPQLIHGLTFFSYCPWLSRTISPDSLFDFSSLLGIAVFFNIVAFALGKLVDAFGPSYRKQGFERYARWWKEFGALMMTAVVAAGLVWCWIHVFSAIDGRSSVYACFAMPALLAVLTLSEVYYIGVASYFTDEMDREFWARAGAWDLIVISAWIAISALSLYGPMLIVQIGPIAKAALLGTGAAAGGIAAKIGRSALSGALAGAKEEKQKQSVPSRLLSSFALPVALLVFAVILMAFLAYLATWLIWAIGVTLGHSAFLVEILEAVSAQVDLTSLLQACEPQQILDSAPIWCVAAAAILLWLVQDGMGRVIHVNKFSLHAAYGNRIIRAYLGASRGRERKPHPFTGFDPHDNVCMTEFAGDDVKRPLHIVNIALNLVRGENLAWQERKAASFTASALHCGGYDVDYRPTAKYGGGEGMTLGTAITISGAAFSPNAGYHSSPLLTFVMAFFNVRLGWWLGNPRFDQAREPGPTHAASPLVAETFGLTDDKNKWVYLSDGGHFDNLGLYEMVARRVRQIVVIDASADPKYQFEDLGNAIRKIRADFGISIKRMGAMKIGRRVAGGAYCATFSINYSEAHKIGNEPKTYDGRLLYIKPALNGSEPEDVTQYATSSSDFPHDTTADQFFTESQFESYRVLGMHELESIVDGKAVTTVGELIKLGETHNSAAKP